MGEIIVIVMSIVGTVFFISSFVYFLHRYIIGKSKEDAKEEAIDAAAYVILIFMGIIIYYIFEEILTT